ncbi:hypothetical protein ACLHWC_03830 [Vagococcus salmoninarum]
MGVLIILISLLSLFLRKKLSEKATNG